METARYPRFTGKVALVTGAARGQGRHHCLRLAEEGADILALDTSSTVDTITYPLGSPEELTDTVAEVRKLGRRAVALDADLRDLDGLTAGIGKGVAELGRLDVVLANAGISNPAPTLDMSEHQWQTMIDINLTGVWKTLKAAVPHIRAGGRGGSIVITSSLATFHTEESIGHYTAAKLGAVGLMKVLAKELAPERIRVNTVHPTTVATPMILKPDTYKLFRPDLENPSRADFEEVASSLNRMGVAMLDVDDVSGPVLHLASDEARFVTGTTYVVDAGASLS